MNASLHRPLPPDIGEAHPHPSCTDASCVCGCRTCAAFRAVSFSALDPLGLWPAHAVPLVPRERPRAPRYIQNTRLTIGDATIGPNRVETFRLTCKHVTHVRRLYIAVAHPDETFLTSVKIGNKTLLERRDDGLSSRRFLEGEHAEDVFAPYETIPEGTPIEVSVRNKFRDHQVIHVYVVATELHR